jgi:hypothetical protein
VILKWEAIHVYFVDIGRAFFSLTTTNKALTNFFYVSASQ